MACFGVRPRLLLCLLIMTTGSLIALLLTQAQPAGTSHGRMRPIILDESRCPSGWRAAGEQCVQLQFASARPSQAESECRRMGAKLVEVLDSEGDVDSLVMEDLSDILEEALEAGVPEQSWLISSGAFLAEWDTGSERVRFRPLPKDFDGERPLLGLRRRRGQSIYELVILFREAAQPFVCALTPLWHKLLLYDQAMLPRGAPRLEEEPRANYFFDSAAANDSFLSLPCAASGNPTPTIRWFRNGGDEIDLNSSGTPFVVSGGALLVPLSRLPAAPQTFHCMASNKLGTVRSQTATVRPAFIEPFRESRLDAFPLISGASKGGGARLECNAPRHFPRSFSFSWVRGGSYEKFVEVSPRLFISMDGTLYFAYNVRQDEDRYACTLTSAATHSAQHGPFFQLHLPLGHINPKLKQPGKALHPHAFAPRIDEFQPQLFPEVPTRGQSVYLECFAYGFPVPTYRWTRVDGLPLPSGRHKLLSFGRILRIDAAELADSGRYRCTVQNEVGTASAELRLAVQAPPSLLRPLVDRLAAPNSSVAFHCPVADSSGPIQVEWFRNGQPLVPLLLGDQDRGRFKLEDNELSILSLHPEDTGIYQCLASNEVGAVSSSALLHVAAMPPRFHGNVFPASVHVVEDGRLSLPCLFQSSPPARARWMRISEDGAKRQAAHTLVDQFVPGTEIALLNLEKAHALDSGHYECEATNQLGTARAIVRVEIIPRPQVSIRQGYAAPDAEEEGTSNGRKVFNCELEINCHSAEDCPEALFSWQFNDRPIRSLAKGRAGERIRMRQREQLRRRDADKKVVVSQQSQLELPAGFAEEQVGRFACNSLFGGATVELESPISFIPLRLSVQEVDDNGAKLLYRMVQLGGHQQSTTAAMKRRGFAADGRPQQRLYQLEARTARDRRWQPLKQLELGESEDWPGEIQLDQLEPNQRYQFRLRPAGDRIASISLSEWIQTPQAVPSEQVRNLRYRMLDDRHVLLEWEQIERTHHSAPGLRYNVSWKLPEGQEQAEFVESPRIVIGLPEKEIDGECTVLDVGVRPVNQKGPARMATNTVVRASGKAPQRFAADLKLETVNGTHLNLSWHWMGQDQCENVIGAKIVCTEEGAKAGDDQRPNSTKGEVSQSVPADYTQWQVHSLLPEREYICHVQAFDQYGRNGPLYANSVARARTAEKAPERAPEISFVLVKEAEIGAGYAVLLDWRAVPLSGNHSAYFNGLSAVGRAHQRGYKIFVYVSETAEQPIVLTLTEAELHDPQRPSARIDGLKPMFFYGIEVSAFNPGGLGPPSERIPIRVGARQQPNPALVRHQSSSGIQRRRFSTPLSMLIPALFTFVLSLIHNFRVSSSPSTFSLSHSIPFCP